MDGVSPERRAGYAQVMAEVLVPGGELVGLFWARKATGGPPFPLSRAELRDVFAPFFEVAHEGIPPDSVATRAGQEILLVLRRRGSST